MTGLWLHRSNRLEVLAAGLARLVRTDPGDPFMPERIVVPHPAVGQWLSLELARELGIAANVRFEQPAEFAWWLMRGVVPGLSREQPYKPARLRWRIHDLLSGPGEVPETHPAGDGVRCGSVEFSGASAGARGPEGAVDAYLRDDDPRKRFELADRLARMYDQCLLYRPDWIREWESGSTPHWQARLWQRLVELDGPCGPHHWVGALERFRHGFRGRSPAAQATDPAAGGSAGSSAGQESVLSPHPPSIAPTSSAADLSRPPGWPRRASFFAVQPLSPSYLELIREVSQGVEIHLFLMDPCQEYWGDIHSWREIDRRTDGEDPDAHYFTEGNELLAAWGRAGRDVFDALAEAADVVWDDGFVSPDGRTRLAAVQRDILDLRLASEAAQAGGSPASVPGPGAGPAAAPPRPTTADAPGTAPASGADAVPPATGRTPARDDSIQIHVCHSPVREAEVLHDRLLALFDTHHDLEPADVLVLTPDLETCGPAVEAVFSAAGRIPCNAARARAVESRTLRAFLDLLALPRSRHGAEPVLAPLAAPAVRLRFGIDEAYLPAIRAVVRDAGIRWGVDAAHRRLEDLPETAEHTWRQGLHRLLLGYAMGDARVPVAGIVPCPAGRYGLGGGEVDGALLGRFVSYCEAVFELRDRLAGARRPAQWATVLRETAGVFLTNGSGPMHVAGTSRDRTLAREVADEVGAVRALIRDLEHEAVDAEAPVPLEVVLDVLRERARETGRETMRLADGVTVTSLGPGRIVPAEVVCVVGMNDRVFPRSPSAPSFDVIAAGPARRGDRDVRYEDRFSFLEAFLAARRSFIVTYTGRGLRDDALIPPSVLVDELKDSLGRRFPGAAFETRHPLQPFSPRYFSVPDAGDEDLFSYARGMCAAATMLAGRSGGSGSDRFVGVVLPEPDESRRRVDLSDLATFFANPARAFLRERLGVRLELDDLALADDEPFELDRLEHYNVRVAVWDQIRSGVEAQRAEDLLRGSGRLPQAGIGRLVYGRARAEVEPLEGLLARHQDAVDAPPREIDLTLGEFRVVGTIEHLEHVERGRHVQRARQSRRGPGGGARLDVAGPGGAGSGGPDQGDRGLDRMVWWRIGRLRVRDRIEIRLRQLAWMAAGNAPLEAIVISQEGESWKRRAFLPPDDAREELRRWLEAWWRGLAAPLAFFPRTSFELVERMVRAADGAGEADKARAKAREVWLGTPHRRGERLDPYIGFIYHDDDPLTGEFEALAGELLGPLVREQP